MEPELQSEDDTGSDCELSAERAEDNEGEHRKMGEKSPTQDHVVSHKVASPQAESHTAPPKLLLSGQWNSRKPSCMFRPLFWPTERSSCGSASVHVLDMHLTPHYLASLALAFRASRRVVGMQLRHSIKRRGVSYRYFLMVELSSGSNHYRVKCELTAQVLEMGRLQMFWTACFPCSVGGAPPGEVAEFRACSDNQSLC